RGGAGVAALGRCGNLCVRRGRATRAGRRTRASGDAVGLHRPACGLRRGPGRSRSHGRRRRARPLGGTVGDEPVVQLTAPFGRSVVYWHREETMQRTTALTVLAAFALAPCAAHAADDRLVLDDAAWRKRLSAEAYDVLRHAGTEMPFSSPLDHETH